MTSLIPSHEDLKMLKRLLALLKAPTIKAGIGQVETLKDENGRLNYAVKGLFKECCTLKERNVDLEADNLWLRAQLNELGAEIGPMGEDRDDCD